MPSPELIDFDRRFEDLVRELRATAPSAPDHLRARVHDLAAEPPPESPLRRRFGGRRLTLVLVPVCVLGLVAGAVVAGRGGGHPTPSAARDEKALARVQRQAAPASTLTLSDSAAGRPWALSSPRHSATGAGVAGGSQTFAPVVLPPDASRLQHYDVSLSLRVQDQDALSKATNEAMRLTRGFGGFVAGVEYSSAENTRGDATLTLRVPIAKIDRAISRFSKLGQIRTQHVSIQDLQAQANAQNRAILDTRKSIASLQEKLGGTNLTAARRIELQHQLAGAQSRLQALLGERGGTIREARLATVSVGFTTAKRKGGAVAPPGRIGRAAHDAVTLLAKLGAGAVYVTILLGPLVLLGFLLVFIARAVRRRGEGRLLARA